MSKGTVADLDRPTGWRTCVTDGWGAVSANELLDPYSTNWDSLHLPPPSPSECLSFAAIDRALKYGKSIAVTLPVTENSLARLVVFLHRLRFDALQGGIRTPWLNSGNCLARKDVVCVTRPAAAIKALSCVPDVSANVIKPHSESIESIVTRTVKGRTALVDGTLNVMELSELIAARTHPIAFILDGTGGGYEHVDQLDIALFESFPLIPRIILLSLGDQPAIERLRNSRSSTHLWITRLEDARDIFNDSSIPSLHLDVLNDTFISTQLQSIGKDLVDLRNVQKQIKDPVLKEKLSCLNKVWRSLGELAQPLSCLESVLEDRTRPGLFPVRTLSRWLDIAEKGSCLFGEQQHLVANVISKLRAFHSLLLQGLSGKGVFVLDKATQSLTTGRSIMVLVGSHHEADSMERWLDRELPVMWGTDDLRSKLITIYSMDGIRAFRESKAFMDDIFIVGIPWENRQHWLSNRCNALHFVCYEHEETWYRRTIQQWWLSAGAKSDIDGDKYRFWSLLWNPKITDTPNGRNTPANILVASHANMGKYPSNQSILAIPLNTQVDDWLDSLISDTGEPRTAHDAEEISHEFALIYTDKNQSAIPWAIHRNLLVLGDEKISTKRPDSLRAGDNIVLLKTGHERIATQDSLFDLLLASEGMRQLIRIANQWNDLIDQVNLKTKGKIADIRKLLDKEGVEVGEEAIKNWIAHRVIGPQNTDAILIFAKFLKMEYAENQAKVMSNAIKKIRSTHQQLGIELRKALLESAATKSHALRIGSHLIERELLNEMIVIQTVISVQLPTTESQKVRPKTETLQSIVDDLLQQSNNKLLFTNPALKSLRDSGFTDTASFKSCLQLMNTRLYEFYAEKKTRLFDVLAYFTEIEIDFQPKMSAVTMGKYFEARQYKNKPADLGKHFKLGSSRDPKHTMRIHFDWDEEEQLIVIHHAGRHLETSQS